MFSNDSFSCLANCAVAEKSSEDFPPCTAVATSLRMLRRSRVDSSRFMFSAAPGLPQASCAASLRSAGFLSRARFQEFVDLLFGHRRQMELQAPRTDRLQQGIGRWRQQNQRRRFRRLFQDFQEQVGVIPAHGVRAIDNEDSPPSLRLEISRALHRAQLPHANHRPRHRTQSPHRIGNQQPHIRMRFDDQRHPFHGCRVRAFAALGQAPP